MARPSRLSRGALAELERAGALAFNARPGHDPSAGGRGARARPRVSPPPTGRSVGSSTVTSTRSSALPSRRPAELRDRELAAVRRRTSARGRVGRRPDSRRGTAGRDPSDGRRGRFCAASRRSARAPAVCIGRSCSPAMGRGRRVPVWIDLTDEPRVEIDTSWYRSHGLRASVSHRVVFHDAPVLARFGAARRARRPPVVLARRAAHGGELGRDGRHRRGRRARRPRGASVRDRARRPGRRSHSDRPADDRRVARASRRAMDAVERRAAGRRASRPGRDLGCLPDAARRGRARVRLEAVCARPRRSIGRGATSRSSCSSTDSTRCSPGPAHAAWPVDRERMTAQRLRGALPGRSRSVGLHDERLRARQVRGDARGLRAGPFADALELGASIGVFSALLAPRCRRLTTIDGAPTAVELARRRLRTAPGVQIVEASIPAGSRIPAGLRPRRRLGDPLLPDPPTSSTRHSAGSGGQTRPGARLVAVHWRPDGPERPLTADEVHASAPSRSLAARPSTEPTPMTTGSTYWSAYEREL